MSRPLQTAMLSFRRGLTRLQRATKSSRRYKTNPLYSMKMAILRSLATSSGQAVNKINLIGRPYARGPLEESLGKTFSPEQRAMADRAFEELKADAFICPTYGDLAAPEDWVLITDRGRQAIESDMLDALDGALAEISRALIDVRAGAWQAITSGRADAIRQAAHSGRELIEQTLKEGAPDNSVRSEPSFLPDRGSSSGVTRRHRIRFLMRKFRGEVSDSDLAVAEAAMDLVLAVDARLQAASHARTEPSRADVTDALQAAELALRHVLGVNLT